MPVSVTHIPEAALQHERIVWLALTHHGSEQGNTNISADITSSKYDFDQCRGMYGHRKGFLACLQYQPHTRATWHPPTLACLHTYLTDKPGHRAHLLHCHFRPSQTSSDHITWQFNAICLAFRRVFKENKWLQSLYCCADYDNCGCRLLSEASGFLQLL